MTHPKHHSPAVIARFIRAIHGAIRWKRADERWTTRTRRVVTTVVVDESQSMKVGITRQISCSNLGEQGLGMNISQSYALHGAHGPARGEGTGIGFPIGCLEGARNLILEKSGTLEAARTSSNTSNGGLQWQTT